MPVRSGVFGAEGGDEGAVIVFAAVLVCGKGSLVEPPAGSELELVIVPVFGALGGGAASPTTSAPPGSEPAPPGLVHSVSMHAQLVNWQLGPYLALLGYYYSMPCSIEMLLELHECVMCKRIYRSVLQAPCLSLSMNSFSFIFI